MRENWPHQMQTEVIPIHCRKTEHILHVLLFRHEYAKQFDSAIQMHQMRTNVGLAFKRLRSNISHLNAIVVGIYCGSTIKWFRPHNNHWGRCIYCDRSIYCGRHLLR